MERTLDYPPVKFNGTQALWIARAFAAQVETSGFEIYACAILPRHTHFVVGRHRYNVEQITNLLKGAATRMLIARGLHPMRDHVPAGSKLPSPWTTGLWKVFLDSNEDVERSVRYVQQNPGKDGKKPQKWSFVRAYQG
jgi:REP element-mobilizing transposase RayT